MCIAASIAVPVACATVQTAQAPTAPPPPAVTQVSLPEVSAPDPQLLFGLARLAGAFDLAVPPVFVERMVRWELGLRDLLHGTYERLAALQEEASRPVPDLTVLAIEPVARTESSGFGWRDDPIRHTRSFHSGTDFRGHPGTPVVAAGDGIVTYAGRWGGYGNMIDVSHGGGVITRYAHLRRIAIKKDAAITAGQKIGELGSTGRTTGPHLHFEVRIDGAPVSPIAAMRIAQLQREAPLAGHLAALSLSPELQRAATSEVDPPKQRAKATQRPERTGRTRRSQVLW